MAKRSRTAVRPGQRRPIQRRPGGAPPPASPSGATATPSSPSTPGTPAPRPSAGLTEAEARRAEELEAQIRGEERALEASRRASRDRARERAEATPAGASLAVTASHEYDYVARDIRRIAAVAALLLGILFGVWILIEVLGVVRIA